MPTTTNVEQVKLNIMTKAQYDAATKDSTQLYAVVDAGEDIIDFQLPTAANGYTWYRKYRSGWVEQGGLYTGGSQTINLLVVMSDTNYYYNVSFATGVTPAVDSIDIVVPTGANGTWEIKGMSA